jgi:hypothetical protein
VIGLREVLRVLKPGAKVALGFTSYSGQAKEGLSESLLAAGFVKPSIVEFAGSGFCMLATKPATPLSRLDPC